MNLRKCLGIGMLFVLIVSVISCSKPQTKTIFVSQSLKDHFNFKVGSYWIYSDSVTGKTDSLFVTYNNSVVGGGAGQLDNIYQERIDINFSQAGFDTSIYPLDWAVSLYDSSFTFVVTEVNNAPIEQDGGLFFSYPFKIGKPRSYVEIVDILAGLTINGINYDKVAVIDYSLNKASLNLFYVNDHDFIVKMSFVCRRDSQRHKFELLRKNIVIM